MADPVTDNLSLILMATGTASGTWGTILNASDITPIDSRFGASTSISVSSSDVALTASQCRSNAFVTTGTLTGNINITFPLNANSTTVAIGGNFTFDNQSTGAFAITVKTVASGSTGVEIPQGIRTVVYSNGTNVYYADGSQNQVQTYNGDPNGNVAGQAGSAATRASKILNRATNQEYLCTTSGTASSAVWSINLPFSFPSQGYLTTSSDATNPVLTGDSLGATTLYYTAFVGNLIFLYNGVSFVPVPITGGQLSLALSASAQAANGIYDVLGFLDSTTLRIGFSPAWQTATAGSGARGTGAGTPQLARVNGILVNAVSQTVNNGASTYSVAANRGTYLGSVFIDSSAGQVTCHRTYGQNRKFGVWNAFNRVPIGLKGGDPNASWTTIAGLYPAFLPANGNSANRVTSFCGLPEEIVGSSLTEGISIGSGATTYVGIGVNSTGTPSGTLGVSLVSGQFPNAATDIAPAIGINNIYALEAYSANGSNQFLGTETRMRLTAQWSG